MFWKLSEEFVVKSFEKYLLKEIIFSKITDLPPWLRKRPEILSVYVAKILGT